MQHLEAQQPLSDVSALGRRRAWRRVRNGVLLVALLAGLVEAFGLPHLRVTYQYLGSISEPRIIAANYWGLTGVKQVGPGRDAYPVVSFFRLERPLRARLRDGAAWCWNWIEQETGYER